MAHDPGDIGVGLSSIAYTGDPFAILGESNTIRVILPFHFVEASRDAKGNYTFLPGDVTAQIVSVEIRDPDGSERFTFKPKGGRCQIVIEFYHP
jgi:hypothetical protein